MIPDYKIHIRLNGLVSNTDCTVESFFLLHCVTFETCPLLIEDLIMLLGIFFILPCVDNYARVDLRTRTYDVPPQEVKKILILIYKHIYNQNQLIINSVSL